MGDATRDWLIRADDPCAVDQYNVSERVDGQIVARHGQERALASQIAPGHDSSDQVRSKQFGERQYVAKQPVQRIG
jgi:hypothetical protein